MKSVIQRIFPLGFPWETQDPFLFCVYHHDHFPSANEHMGPAASLEGRNLGNDFTVKDGWRMYHGHQVPGFPYHPHSGFETITIVNKGFCDHSDSLGAAGRFGEGDVQWMTAGRGVQHSEMFPLLNTASENELVLFQIWLNLSAVNKLVEPHFKMLWHEDIPLIEMGGARVRLISGTYDNHTAPAPAPDSWAADSSNQVAIWDITMNAGSAFELPTTGNDTTRSLFYFEGKELRIEGKEVTSGNGLTLAPGMKAEIINGTSVSRLLLLQGRPIGEPVAKNGPFVMTTEKEIQQRIQEYRLTGFGGWPWPYPDHVHPKEKGRFAKYPDGTLVEKQA